MSKYDEVFNEIKNKVTAKGSKSFSKSDLNSLTQSLLNTPDYKESIVVKNGDDVAEVDSMPVAKYRNELKKVVQSFGIDKNELGKLDTYNFSKDHAEAVNDVAASSIKGYINTGRKYTFPVTSKDESRMSLQLEEVAQKVAETRKIVKTETGYDSVETGNIVTTHPHKSIKASNKIPQYLKTVKKKK